MPRQLNMQTPDFKVKLNPGEKEKLLILAEQNGYTTVASFIQSIANGNIRVINRNAAIVLDELIREYNKNEAKK